MGTASNDQLQDLHNGNLISRREPSISLRDGAIQRGHGIFETMAVYGGKPFAIAEHWKRLRVGADAMELEVPDPNALARGCRELIEANSLVTEERLRMRITVTKGASEQDHWFLQVDPVGEFMKSASAITTPFTRNEKGALTGFKTINYGENIVAMNLARAKGVDEAIFPNTAGMVCEGTWSNLFARIGGSWITPPLSSGCLPGVTRALVLAIAEEGENPIVESDLPTSKLSDVEAAFFTSSIRELQPIHSIDGRTLPDPFSSEWAEWQSRYTKHVRASLAE
ncbi:MAG: aminotransferase class IV [Verrucomicrobiota bacterium]